MKKYAVVKTEYLFGDEDQVPVFVVVDVSDLDDQLWDWCLACPEARNDLRYGRIKQAVIGVPLAFARGVEYLGSDAKWIDELYTRGYRPISKKRVKKISFLKDFYCIRDVVYDGFVVTLTFVDNKGNGCTATLPVMF